MNLRFGLCRLQSPLLTASLLLYFPPLSKMLQFSGYSSLTSGRCVCFVSVYYAAIFIHPIMSVHSMVQACHMYAIFHGSVFVVYVTHTHTAYSHHVIIHDTWLVNATEGEMPQRGAKCIKRPMRSQIRAYHSAFRILLRSSSPPIPRHPRFKMFSFFVFHVRVASHNASHTQIRFTSII